MTVERHFSSTVIVLPIGLGGGSNKLGVVARIGWKDFEANIIYSITSGLALCAMALDLARWSPMAQGDEETDSVVSDVA